MRILNDVENGKKYAINGISAGGGAVVKAFIPFCRVNLGS
jgi:hypothetical protein